MGSKPGKIYEKSKGDRQPNCLKMHLFSSCIFGERGENLAF